MLAHPESLLNRHLPSCQRATQTKAAMIVQIKCTISLSFFRIYANTDASFVSLFQHTINTLSSRVSPLKVSYSISKVILH